MDLSFQLLWVNTKKLDGWVMQQEYVQLCKKFPDWGAASPHPQLKLWTIDGFWREGESVSFKGITLVGGHTPVDSVIHKCV